MPATPLPASMTATTGSRSSRHATRLATQKATVERLSRQIAAGRANVDQAAAQLSSAEAGRTQAELEFNRQQALVAKGFASRQVLDKVRAQRDQAVAAVESADAALTAAKANIDVLKAQQVEESRKLDELKTSLAKAERDLSFTVVRAPIDGVIGNRAVQTGDYVQPGQRLASLVPLDDIYIDANFKETQLSSLKPGQPVDDQHRCPAGCDPARHRREPGAGLRLGVLAPASRQRHRQFHQDRAAPASEDQRALGPR